MGNSSKSTPELLQYMYSLSNQALREQSVGAIRGPIHVEKRVKFFHTATWTDRNMYPLSNQKVLHAESVSGSHLPAKSANLNPQARQTLNK